MRGMDVGVVPGSLAELRRIAQPREYSPSVSDRPYRAVSIYLSVPLARAGASPNGITLGWIAIGLCGVGLLLADAWAIRVLGAVLLQLSYLLDFVDGEVARLSDRRSATGGFIDLLGHGLLKASLPLAAGAAAGWQSGQVWPVAAGAVASVVIVVGDALRFYAACTLNDLTAGDLGHDALPARQPGDRRPTAKKALLAAFLLSFESPGLYGLTLLATLADRLDALVVYWAVGGFAWFSRRAIAYCRRMS